MYAVKLYMAPLTLITKEEEALINEMEVTGQAFEETQDQNVRLIQQLREKDNANFKLMSERIKSNQINKLANEERDNLQEQVINYKFLLPCTIMDRLTNYLK